MNDWQIRQEALLCGSCRILEDKTVAIFGIGGVGSFCAEALVRAGVGHLIFIDGDTVSVSNINRQLIADTGTVGSFKAEVMKKRALAVNPRSDIVCINEFVTPDMLDGILYGVDFIADAVDTVELKVALAKYASENKVGIIASMGTGNKLHPELFEIADIYKTSVCPLCRIMRSKLKENGVLSLPVVYSREEPIKAVADTQNGRHSPASISFVPPVSGMIMAGYIVRKLCNISE